MATSVTVDFEFSEEEFIVVLGPIAPSSIQRVVNVAVSHTAGDAGVDLSEMNISAALTTTATASLANMAAGVSLLRYSPFVYVGTAIPMMIQYVVVGSPRSFMLPIPAFTGADRYVVLALTYTTGGNDLPRVTAEFGAFPVAVDFAEYYQQSALIRQYQNYNTAEGSTWRDGATLSVLVGVHNACSVSMFPVVAVTADLDLTALVTGVQLVSTASAPTFNGVKGVTIAIPSGQFREFRFRLPSAQGQLKWPLIYVDDDIVPDNHLSTLFRIEDNLRTPRRAARLPGRRDGLGK